MFLGAFLYMTSTNRGLAFGLPSARPQCCTLVFAFDVCGLTKVVGFLASAPIVNTNIKNNLLNKVGESR
jgi:hypothetical protein